MNEQLRPEHGNIRDKEALRGGGISGARTDSTQKAAGIDLHITWLSTGL